jgi:hypothetical protein
VAGTTDPGITGPGPPHRAAERAPLDREGR